MMMTVSAADVTMMFMKQMKMTMSILIERRKAMMKKGMLKYDTRNGYSYERNGRTYDLLEGKSLSGDTTSDICFVIETDDECGYKDLNTWFCIGGINGDPDKLLALCDEIIEDGPTAEEKIVELNEKNKELNQIIKSKEREIEELRTALLLATRAANDTPKGIKLHRQTFYDLYNHSVGDDELMDQDIYGHDVYVFWHGVYCNCADGATAANYIIEGIKDCLEEDDNENY